MLKMTSYYIYGLMLQQMQENMLLQTIDMCDASDTQTIQSFNWSKWRALWRYLTFHILSQQNVISDGPKTCCQCVYYRQKTALLNEWTEHSSTIRKNIADADCFTVKIYPPHASEPCITMTWQNGATSVTMNTQIAVK